MAGPAEAAGPALRFTFDLIVCSSPAVVQWDEDIGSENNQSHPMHKFIHSSSVPDSASLGIDSAKNIVLSNKCKLTKKSPLFQAVVLERQANFFFLFFFFANVTAPEPVCVAVNVLVLTTIVRLDFTTSEKLYFLDYFSCVRWQRRRKCILRNQQAYCFSAEKCSIGFSIRRYCAVAPLSYIFLCSFVNQGWTCFIHTF